MSDDWFESQLKKAVTDAKKLEQWMQIRRQESASDEGTIESSHCSTESNNSASDDSNNEIDLRLFT